MQDLELSVTICSWNTKEDLFKCLESLHAIRDEARFEVVVVDNNSADGSPLMVRENFPWVRLYVMNRNYGFTGGQNWALAHRKAPHALLLNSDTVVHPGAFRKLLDYAYKHPDVGIIGPRLLNPDGTLQFSCRRFPNPVAALFRNTPIGKLFPNNRFSREYLMMDMAHDKPAEVDWVSGAAQFGRLELIQKIGLLDDKYFMFCEDIDWCWRCWKAGYKVVYLPESVITHAVGKSTDKAPNRMIGGHHRSMYRFYAKNVVPDMAAWKRPFARGFAASTLGLRASVFIVKNKFDKLVRRLKG